jgi:L-malate glycosyltransferase
MKVTLIADPFSAHVIKWANGLQKKGVDISIFGLSEYNASEYHHGIKISLFKVPEFIKWRIDGSILKSAYLFGIPKLRRFIKEIKPDIIHAHSASSYGLLGALSNFHPYVISVWGNDVFNFPRKSPLLKKLLEYNLSRAEGILSTSHFMAKETKKYTSKQINVLPFGIDINFFAPAEKQKNEIVIGTVKSMEHKYGVVELMKAFHKIKNKYPDLPLKLLLVGRGSLLEYLKKLSVELDIAECTEITGFVPFSKVPFYHNRLDISVFPSTEDSETFGVSVLEASACCKPVIVSDIGGLPEVVKNNETGFIIPPGNVDKLSEQIERLVLNKELRQKLGCEGRKHVERNFNFDDNLNTNLKFYNEILNRK